jgi:hypothetical protein
VENIRAMTDSTREYGVYSRGHSRPAEPAPVSGKYPDGARLAAPPGRKPAGACVPWNEKRAQIPSICGDESLLQQVWEHIDGLANTYLWQLLLSF